VLQVPVVPVVLVAPVVRGLMVEMAVQVSNVRIKMDPALVQIQVVVAVTVEEDKMEQMEEPEVMEESEIDLPSEMFRLLMYILQ